MAGLVAAGRRPAVGEDGPGWLLAAVAATLPTDRRDWGAALLAELAQVQGPARWRFAGGCARSAVFPPRGSQAAVAITGAWRSRCWSRPRW